MRQTHIFTAENNSENITARKMQQQNVLSTLSALG